MCSLLYVAKNVQQRGWDSSANVSTMALRQSDVEAPFAKSDLLSVLHSISGEPLRYFHGLVEALEVYRSIHGRDIALEPEKLRDSEIHELRQIRNMCLENAEAISIY